MKKIFTGILIIVSSSIGAGILGMPITCSLAGFIPSVIIMLLTVLYMNILAKIIIKLFFVTNSTDLTNIFEKILSKKFSKIGDIIYCFLFISINSAYISKSTELIQIIAENITKYKLDINICYAIIILITTMIINTKNDNFNYTNKILTIFLIGMFIIIIAKYLVLETKIKNLTYTNLTNIKYIYPILITSFGFHNILPYIKNEFKNEDKINKIINIGMIITLIIYLTWIFLIMSVKDEYYKLGTLESYKSDKIITELITKTKNNNIIIALLNIFSFTAIITSIFSIVISMKLYFLTKIKNINPLILNILILIPPLIIIKINTHIFFTALEISGSILTLIFFGLLPITALSRAINKNLFKMYFLNIITIIIIIISIIIQITK